MEYNFEGIANSNSSFKIDERGIGASTNVFFTEMNHTDINTMNFSEITTTEENDSLLKHEDYIEFQIAKYLWRYYPPFILVLGTIGNILCFLVTMRRPMRRSSVGLCLAVLAVADTLVLFVGLGRNYTIELSGWDIREVHECLCKLHRFFLYFGLDFSAWILVTITIERYISVCYPFKANTMCTVSRTKKVLVIVAVLVVIENVMVFWARGREYETIGNYTKVKKECGYPGNEQYFYWRIIRPYNVIALYAIGPFTTMIICSIRIVYRLSKARKMMSVLTNGKSNSDQSLDSVNNPNMTVKVRKQLKSHKESYKMHSMTIMSVVVAIVFLCLSTPSHLEFVIEGYFNKDDMQQFSTFRLIESVTRMLMYTNHGINFIVYCASGERFRKEFVAMVKGKKEKPLYYSTTAAYTTVKLSQEAIQEIRSRDGVKLKRESDA